VGDREEHFPELWGAWHRRVYAYALRRTDQDSAQDVVAETFLVAWRRREDLPPEPLPWLLGVARRVLANHVRSQRRRDALAQVLIDHALRHQPSFGEVDGALLRALAALGEADRELLLLVGWDGLRPAEAAQSLGCSAATFRVRLLRARRRLRALLDAQQAPGDAALAAEVGTT
jgi:RNA polymerase sigma-70 factor (ECF subfamily)